MGKIPARFSDFAGSAAKRKQTSGDNHWMRFSKEKVTRGGEEGKNICKGCPARCPCRREQTGADPTGRLF